MAQERALTTTHPDGEHPLEAVLALVEGEDAGLPGGLTDAARAAEAARIANLPCTAVEVIEAVEFIEVEPPPAEVPPVETPPVEPPGPADIPPPPEVPSTEPTTPATDEEVH